MTTEIKISTTWQKRIVDAAARVAPAGCKLVLVKTPRVIGGRTTTKTDLVARFEPNGETVVSTIEEVFTDLNRRANFYMAFNADMGPRQTPNERRLERRRWLEAEATKVATKLTGGSK